MYRHKNIRLPRSSYIGRATYFLTICSDQRHKFFGQSERCKWLLDHLRKVAGSRSFNVHAYCIMPDHLHVLAEGLALTSNFQNFVKTFKIKTSREFAGWTQQALWQKKYYEHILRPDESVESVAWYIWLNPVRAGLVKSPADYPYSGSFTTVLTLISVASGGWTPPYLTKNRPPQKASTTAL